MIILLFVNSIVVMNANMAWDLAKTYSFLILKYHDVFAKYFVFVEFGMKSKKISNQIPYPALKTKREITKYIN